MPDTIPTSFMPLDAGRLQRAKRGFTTRRVDLDSACTLLPPPLAPLPGDLLLARVDLVSPRNRLELVDGRRAHLFAGDEVLLAFGNRYAPDQYEAQVPGSLDVCELVAAGGLAAAVLGRHDAMAKASSLRALGLLGDAQGRRMNLSQFALARVAVPRQPRPRVIVVTGTSMNSGKTTTVSCLIRGLRASGQRVAALKVTGTGAGGDLWLMKDAGASPVLDFTDAGHASTSGLATATLIEILHTLVAHAAASAPDAIVVEVADGLLQPETAALLRSREFRALADVVAFAAGEAMSADAGVRWLRAEHLPVRLLSGLLTASPLAMREAEASTGLPALTMAQLSEGTSLRALLAEADRGDADRATHAPSHDLAQHTVG